MTAHFDAVVIGAGVIGLAVGRALAAAGRSVLVLERHGQAGSETSSRNSGVIHSGIYYPTGTLKARLCVSGREMLYAYCRTRGVAHRQVGKLIVAQPSQLARLEALQATASRNGVMDLQLLDAEGVQEREPEVRAAAGLWCPSTGIIDVHEFIQALHADVEHAGGLVSPRTEFLEAKSTAGGWWVELSSDGETMQIDCKLLVNSAGLDAVAVLKRIGDYPAQRIPTAYFAKGSYFEFSGRSPFRHLIYPMPGEAGLGVHGTLDMAGRLRFGPNVEWLNQSGGAFDYTVREAHGDSFRDAIREYWPGIPDGSLRASYSGVRPKLVGPGEPAADFRIEGPVDHGMAGLVNLLGMESPGLTASLAVGEFVAALGAL